MGLLHPEQWRDLAPEFEAQALLQQAEAVLREANDTAPVAGALVCVREGMGKLHPCTRDPAALEEFQARRDGTYDDGGQRTRQGGQFSRERDTRDEELAQLREKDAKRDKELQALQDRFELLERRATEPAAPKGKDAPKAEPTK